MGSVSLGVKISQIPIFLIALLLVLPLVSASIINIEDPWYVNDGSNSDAVLWVGDDPVIWVNGIASTGDMVCFDWDGDNDWNNCYWKNRGCGGSCNSSSCSQFPIPGGMGSVHKLGCEDLNSCKEGVYPVFNRVCGYCSEFPTTTPKKWTVQARVYHKCGQPGSSSEEVVASKSFYVVNAHWYNCNDAPGAYTKNTKAYEGDFWNGVASIKPNILCPSGYKCSEFFDDQVSYSRSFQAFEDPCRKDDWQSCTNSPQCASNYCDVECSPCGVYQCTQTTYNKCTKPGERCCANTAQVDQFYCRKSSISFSECSTSIHTACQAVEGYTCTNASNTWAWRTCDVCNTPDGSCGAKVPDITVSPTSLVFDI